MCSSLLCSSLFQHTVHMCSSLLLHTVYICSRLLLHTAHICSRLLLHTVHICSRLCSRACESFFALDWQGIKVEASQLAAARQWCKRPRLMTSLTHPTMMVPRKKHPRSTLAPIAPVTSSVLLGCLVMVCFFQAVGTVALFMHR